MFGARTLRAAALIGFAASAWAQDTDRIVVDGPNDIDVTEIRPIDRIEDTALIVQDVQNRRWIGIACGEVSDVLRSHVDLPEGVGLVVEQVVPNSPAESAGMKVFDILTAAGDRPLTITNDLIKSIAEAGDKSLKLKWLRGGEVMEIEVTPSERIEGTDLEVHAFLSDNDGIQSDIDNIRAWIDKIEQNPLTQGQGNGHGNIRLKILGPGTQMQQIYGKSTQSIQNSLPHNMSISINRSGKEPAKISVQQGESSWNVTENELDALPEEIRGHVKQMLGGKILSFRSEAGSKMVDEALKGMPDINALDVDTPWPKMEQRFQEMQDRMDMMMQRLEQLRILEGQEAPIVEDDSDDA